MPVNLLFVEGNLDSEILAAVFAGSLVVRRGGSKDGLAPQARYEREKNAVKAAYLRDRDFDHEPPQDCHAATVDRLDGDTVLGWRWARHEIENYLLDPAIVERAIGISGHDWSATLTDVGCRIRWYQIARWTIGQVRRVLPPSHQLRTRPAGLNELALPALTDERFSREWCLTSIGHFLEQVTGKMSPECVEATVTRYSEVLTEESLGNIETTLAWCSGKDLLAGLSGDSLRQCRCANAGDLRAALRDWVRENADEAVAQFPEWQDLIQQVRA
ncbi:hypothetical protein [uncultured Thiodictyon sp.]|jgi:hypothetical protein|uniref:hypothetical protein n=1 Tax=uncultured Thiodictyon sp. TaxID=1846217 RepID=UPI0025F80A5D|nr:hypothetical protein [uncultured Thiodictyon sp.]